MTVKALSTVLKCLDTLEVIADQDASVRISELGRLIGQSRATTYQRLLTLTEAGWVERLPDGSYRLSVRALRIAAAALGQAGLGERAQPQLDALARELGDAISLVVLESDRIVIAQRAEANTILRADLRAGATLSYVDSSSGGIWLAFGPDGLYQRLAEKGVPLPSPARVDRVRSERVSFAGGGATLPGIATVAVPVLDANGRCRASLSISTPETRFDAARYIPSLREAAENLAALMAF